MQPFGSYSQWRRSYAASAAAVEDEAIEGEIEQEVSSQTRPSDAQINRAVRHGPVTKFKELAERGMVCQTVVDTITKDMGLETMTQVQTLTITESLKGLDILAQARTGTGKTLAFLIPLLQNIISVDPKLERRSGLGRSGASTDIRAIIISPTRELAEQIAVEAKKVTRDTGVIVQTAVGGTAKAFGLRKLRSEGCHILVGTPGRLNDLLSDPYSKVRAPNLSCFVLDEADRLLDQGFAPDIGAIQGLLPPRGEVDRQTLLYSATVPRGVMQVVRQTMKPKFQFVRTVREGEQPTHEKVPQKLVNVGGFENLMPALFELCKREIDAAARTTGGPARPFKAIVYFAATADVSLAASVFSNLKNPGQNIFHQGPLHPAKIVEIHAKLTQDVRTRAADTFRRAESGIMLSSDVTARGMDFPNVTHVIQIGLPPSEEQYVHRIGRTARGDKTGEGWTLVTSLDANEIRHKLPKMPLKPDNTLETAKVDMTKDAQLPEHTAKILTQIGNAIKMVPRGLKVGSYMAALGIYQWYSNKQKLVDALNKRAKYGWGMESPPMMVSKWVMKSKGPTLLKMREIELWGGVPPSADSEKAMATIGKAAGAEEAMALTGKTVVLHLMGTALAAEASIAVVTEGALAEVTEGTAAEAVVEATEGTVAEAAVEATERTVAEAVAEATEGIAAEVVVATGDERAGLGL
ncbi:MAG: hypothetical protein Q9175_003446, partial [Cornicularia normoerica]